MDLVEISLNDLKKLILKAREFEPSANILVYGRAGIGKSTIVKSLEKEGYKIFELRAIYVDIGDLITRIPEKEEKILKNYYADIFKQIIDAEAKGEKTILLLDEFTQANISVLRMFYQIILDRAIDGLKLPSKTTIIAISNLDKDAEGLSDLTIEKPLWDRFIFRVVIQPNFEEWREWAFANNVNGEVIAFLSKFPEHFYYENDEELKATPRRWDFVSKALSKADKSERELLTKSVLGNELGEKFFDFIELTEKFDIKELLSKGLGGLKEDEKYAVIPLVAEAIANEFLDKNEIDKHLEIVGKELGGDMKVLLLKFIANHISAKTNKDRDKVKYELNAKSKVFAKYLSEVSNAVYG